MALTNEQLEDLLSLTLIQKKTLIDLLHSCAKSLMDRSESLHIILANTGRPEHRLNAWSRCTSVECRQDFQLYSLAMDELKRIDHAYTN